jgi:hypothetical protein
MLKTLLKFHETPHIVGQLYGVRHGILPACKVFSRAFTFSVCRAMERALGRTDYCWNSTFETILYQLWFDLIFVCPNLCQVKSVELAWLNSQSWRRSRSFAPGMLSITLCWWKFEQQQNRDNKANASDVTATRCHYWNYFLADLGKRSFKKWS